ncbi:MAG: hypothetical protein R3F14_09785 [Polyangiaceae bacterium]
MLVSNLNVANNPVYSFLLALPNGVMVPLPHHRPRPRASFQASSRALPSLDADLGKFKIPTMWGVKDGPVLPTTTPRRRWRR